MKKKLILFIIVITSLESIAQKKLPITLESIWSGYFDQKDISPQILNTRPAVAFIRADKATNFEGILSLDMANGKIIDTLFSNQVSVERVETPTTFAFFEDFSFSPDDSKILIKTDKQIIHSISHKEFVYIWDDVKKTLKPVSTDGKISHAEFNSTGKLLSYIRDGNLFIRNIETDKATAVTSDAQQGSIINAMADEMYEDGFGLSKMYEWNPAGTKIAFIKINQGIVKKYPIINYEKNDPSIVLKSYSKPGEAISEASLYVYDIKENSFSKMDLGGTPNQYVLNFKWEPNGASIFVERMSRTQKRLEVIQCYANNGNIAKTVLVDEKPDYVLHNKNNLLVCKTKPSFFWLTEKDGYNHIYEVNYKTDSIIQITKGKWEVSDVKGFNESEEIIYFMANKESSSQNHLYQVKTNGKGLEKLTDSRGWHNTWLSNDMKYFFDKSTTINSPSQYKIFKTSGKEITNKAIIENKRYTENTKNFDVNDCKYFGFDNKQGNRLNGWIINGDNIPQAKKKPLLLYVYGGNNKQEAFEEWNDRMAMTFRYFANKGFTVACLDPSGTPGKGEAFRKATFNNLADLAVSDLVQAKEYLINNYNIDSQNTALMGWSYGGYITSMAATKFAGSFNKYIAIAPVTNWRDYNAPFTERILKMPSDNPEQYRETKPEEYVSNYKGGLLLIHGSSDQNVHVQHSLRLAKALTETDLYYDIQIFTDKGHSLSDGPIDKTRMNLFRKIYKFLERKEID